MGAAGDMLLAALLDLTGNPGGLVEKLNALGLPGVRFAVSEGKKRGLRGLSADVTVHGCHEEDDRHHHHTGLSDIQSVIASLPVSQTVKDNAGAVYRLIADAEAEAHGCPVDLVHFHEVGAMDAVADVAGVCMLMEALSPDTVLASPVHAGSGTVKCAHGVMPVPAPATAVLLRGVPVYGGEVRGELCTPTGAALLKHFVKEFAPLPPMSITKTGIGLGKKDFDPYCNCVRLFWGEAAGGANDAVAELRCNLDDMTGEEIGFAAGVLFKEGALDVFATPVQMKKNRPGVLLTLLCPVADADRFAALMLKHTTTFGVRKTVCERYILERSVEKRVTPYGEIAVKTGRGYGVCKEKAEYDSVAEKTGL
jgi:uncharacterized protein (TIGR00299 family) protein